MKPKSHFAMAALVLATLLLTGCAVNPQDIAQVKPNVSISLAGVGSYRSGSCGAAQILTMAEVAKHNSSSDCWIAINGTVVDMSVYTSHPGGDGFKVFCGKDGTDAYASIHGGKGHSAYADSLLKDFEVGVLGQAYLPSNSSTAEDAVSKLENDEEDDEDG